MSSSVKNQKNKRERLLKMQKNICALCNKIIENPTLDHIIPKSRGGKNNLQNLQVACYSCNQQKGNKMPEIVPQATSGFLLCRNRHYHFRNIMNVDYPYKFVEPDGRLKKFLLSNMDKAQTIEQFTRNKSIKYLQIYDEDVIFKYSKSNKSLKVHNDWQARYKQPFIRIYPECHLEWSWDE